MQDSREDHPEARKGLEGLRKQLLQVLQREGLKEIKAEGKLDPFAHEDGISGEGSRRRIVLSGLEASQNRRRTNIALFLTPGSTGNAQVDVRVLDSFGREKTQG